MRRGKLLLLMGLVLALGAAVIVAVVLRQQPAEAPPPEAKFAQEAEPTGVPTQKVWVALQPIPRGGDFVEGTLGLRDWPTSNVPPDVIGDVAETIGRVAAIDIVQGMPILRSMLAEKGAAGQAALLIPDGKVAVAYPIDEQSSVAYAIQPGDYVDVLIVASFVDMDEDFAPSCPTSSSSLPPILIRTRGRHLSPCCPRRTRASLSDRPGCHPKSAVLSSTHERRNDPGGWRS